MGLLLHYDNTDDRTALTRLVGGLVVTEVRWKHSRSQYRRAHHYHYQFHDLPIVCTARELYTVTPPAGQTCEAYFAPFIAEAGGYIDNPSATDACGYCNYRVGDEFVRCIPFPGRKIAADPMLAQYAPLVRPVA